MSRYANYIKARVLTSSGQDEETSGLIWRVDYRSDLKLFGSAISYWLETKTRLIPVNKTGYHKQGKTLARNHFKEYPTITLRRQIAVAFPSGERYLVLVNISAIMDRPWMQSAFSTHCDELTLDLANFKRPHALLECLKFRELSGISLSSNVLGEEELGLLKQEINQKWTAKWTANEIVKGIEETLLPDRGQEIPFLKLALDATVDHSRDYYLSSRDRWNHLKTAEPFQIKKALDNFQASCQRKWMTPTRQSVRLRGLVSLDA
jgi:hypothetical protein